MNHQVGPLSEREAPEWEVPADFEPALPKLPEYPAVFDPNRFGVAWSEGQMLQFGKQCWFAGAMDAKLAASRAPVVQPADARSLQAYFDLTEPLLGKFVFTAEKAGEVHAIVNAAKAALAAAPSVGVPLSDERIEAIWDSTATRDDRVFAFARAIEAELC